MAGDHKFYYDFESEIPIKEWEEIEKSSDRLALRATVDHLNGSFVFLSPADSERFPVLLSVAVNGVKKTISKRDAVFLEHDYSRFGVEIELSEGENQLIAEFSLKEGVSHENINIRLQRAEQPFCLTSSKKPLLHAYPEVDYIEKEEKELSLEGFYEGIGREVSPGRFGFSKGDGLLDCAMPSLGMVDKMFLCGQPKYRKPYRWSYSLLPEGMPLHGSFEPRDMDIWDDEISVNHLSVNWKTEYLGKKFSITYSLASAAILTEREDGKMSISGLRYAGNYTSLLIPKAEGVVECSVDEADISDMAHNWLMLFNSTEFPDVPLMLIFDRNPLSMTVTRDEYGRLLSIDFTGTPLMLSLTPFGIERFDPFSMPIEDAIRRAELWSRAALAYPVGHKDYFRLNEAEETVTVRQKFEYRFIKDTFGTEPLITAPLPPPLTISGVASLPDALDLEFPTKYGHLYAVLSDTSEYTLPMMPIDRRFPIPASDSKITEILSEGMDEFVGFSSSFSPSLISYPYAGAHLEAFALASSMSLYMKESDRDYFREKLRERLNVALDRLHRSEYVVLNWGEMMAENPDFDRVKEIYSDINKKRMTIGNFFPRVEPFTKTEFDICYLNVSNISNGRIKTATEEEILGLKIPLIENDWGVGLTFYYLYLASLAVGSFDAVRSNWEEIKKLYSFFEYMQDFACMGTGYSDNAITWVEGANYGAFTSFIKMAEAVGDEESVRLGKYNAAKQFALRLAIMRSSVEYFPKYFEVSPWYVAKYFHEELSPSFAFQNYPDLYFGDLRRDAVYNFTTEGLYPEAYTGLRKFGGEIYRDVMNRLREALIGGLENPGFHWGIIQQYTGMLIDMANDENADRKQFSGLVDFGLKNELIVSEWRGIHIFTRALPKNYFLSQLIAWEETKEHKAWLVSWEEVTIEKAVYLGGEAEISFRHSGLGRMKILLGVKEIPEGVYLNGEEIDYVMKRSEKLEICPRGDGLLRIKFKE